MALMWNHVTHEFDTIDGKDIVKQLLHSDLQEEIKGVSSDLRGPDVTTPVSMPSAPFKPLDYHYLQMKIEPMEYALENELDACQQTIIKYVTRWKVKHGLRDLEAAMVVLDKYIDYEKNGVWPKERA